MRVKRNPSLPRVPRAPRTFVIRVLAEGDACIALHGQISEPTSDEGWQATFASAEELWVLMQGRLGIKLRQRISRPNSRTHPRTTGKTYA